WALKEYALHAGIEIKTGATVTHIEDSGQIWLTDGVRLEQVALSCKKIFVCTNAFTPSLLPHYDLKPGRGQVLLTEPIPNLSLRGIFHFDEAYYYFRELEGRVLSGGGRIQDFVGETTNEIALNAAIQQDMELKLNTLILPGKNIRIDMRWAGIMAFGKSKQPVVEHLGGQLFGAFRMGGMG